MTISFFGMFACSLHHLIHINSCYLVVWKPLFFFLSYEVGMHPSVLQVMNADWRVDEESQCNEKGRRKRRKKVVMKEARAIQEKEGAKEEKEVDHWVERAMLDEKVVARMLMSLSQPLSKQMDTEGIKKENGDAISQDKFAVPSDSKVWILSLSGCLPLFFHFLEFESE